MDRFDGQSGRSLDSESEDEDSDEDSDEEYVSDLTFTLEQNIEFYQTVNPAANKKYVPHKTIRNYFNIISRPDYIKPEIGLQIKLDTGETVAIIKTFWLKIVQRRWRNVLKKRMQMIYCALKNREYGIRADLPKLRGCLADLRKPTVSL